MVKLSVNNSLSVLSGLTIPDFRAIKKLLSYKTGPQNKYTKSLLSRQGEFPTGVLYIVKRYLSKIEYVLEDLRTQPKPIVGAFNIKLMVSPTQDQRNAATALLERYRGILVASTGYGKSLIIGLIINLLKVPTLIIVPSLELKAQLTESLRSWFPKEVVGGFGSRIAVENIDSTALTQNSDYYGCLIVDEFHRSASKTYRDLNRTHWNGIYYRCGLTATPFRAKDEEKLLLESLLAQVIYNITFQDAVKQLRTVPIEAYAYTVPKSKVKPKRFDDYNTAYETLIVNKPERNELIVDVAAKLYGAGQSTLILVQQIEHGEVLREMLASQGCDVPFANGQDADSRKIIKDFSDGKFPLLIGSSILSEGIDTRACEWVLLAGGPGNSRGQLMQKCGRAVRKYKDKLSAKIITFIEKECLWFRNHHVNFVKAVREEYGVEVINL